MDFGYIRILEQEEKDRALRDKVLEMLEDERTLFVDIRNKDYTRPAYERMCDMIQPGDVIYIDELDSLGRTYEDMAAEWYRLTHDWTIDVVVLSDRVQLDSRVFRQLGEEGKRLERQMLDLLVYMAELQHRKVRDNQREGIEKARQAGRRFGRPSSNFMLRKKRAIYLVQPTYSTPANKIMPRMMTMTVSEPNAS